MPIVRGFMILVLALVAAGARDADPPPRRPAKPLEREHRQESDRLREEQRKATEARAREAISAMDRAPELAAVLHVEWDREFREFIESAPATSNMKGWSREIFQFERDWRGRTPTSIELQRWMDAEIAVRGGESRVLAQNKFRGALRELSDVCLLRVEHYTNVSWNRRPERVTYALSSGKVVDLGERVIDIVAERPSPGGERPASGEPAQRHRIYIETKNADLTRTPYKREVDLLAQRVPVERLVEHCNDPNMHKSREFVELVKDICLIESHGRTIVWKANVARGGLQHSLRHYGIELTVYH